MRTFIEFLMLLVAFIQLCVSIPDEQPTTKQPELPVLEVNNYAE